MTIFIMFGILYCVVEIVISVTLKPESASRHIISYLFRLILSFLISYFGIEAFLTTAIRYNWLTVPAGIFATVTVYILLKIGNIGYDRCYILWSICIYWGLLELYILWKTENSLVHGPHIEQHFRRMQRTEEQVNPKFGAIQ
ncbi:hypothetical protein B9Z55_009454 [Caenorhabditis nigoni]|nr:hypothetical protein B9Z55_009454 [Caenorhabditis nigoni]